MVLSKIKTWRWINIVPAVLFIGLFLFEYIFGLNEHEGIVIFDFVLPIQYVIYYMCFTSSVLLILDLILHKKALFFVAYGVSAFHCLYFAFCSYGWMIYNYTAMIGFAVDCFASAIITIIVLIEIFRSYHFKKIAALESLSNTPSSNSSST